MKAFGKTVGKTVVFCLVMMLMCSFVYPLALTGVSQLTMKAKADGNKVDKDGNLTTDTKEAVGSALIGQDFTEDCYFQGRVSAVNYNTYTEEQKESGEYAGVASGSYNYANSNPELKERMEKRSGAVLKRASGSESRGCSGRASDSFRFRSGSTYQFGICRGSDPDSGKEFRTL